MNKRFKSFFIIWCIAFVLFNAAIFCLPVLLGDPPFFRQVNQKSFDAWVNYVLFVSALFNPLAAVFVQMLLDYDKDDIRFWGIPMNAVCYASMGLTVTVGGLCLLYNGLNMWVEAGLSLVVVVLSILPIFRMAPCQPKENPLKEREYKIYDLSSDDWFHQFMIDYLEERQTHLDVLKALKEEKALSRELEQRCLAILDTDES